MQYRLQKLIGELFSHGLRTPRESGFSKIRNFCAWADKLGWNCISGQTISTILALWVPCLWENVAGSLSYKTLCFLGLKHITPKCSQNKILAVKNLGTAFMHFCLRCVFSCVCFAAWNIFSINSLIIVT